MIATFGRRVLKSVECESLFFRTVLISCNPGLHRCLTIAFNHVLISDVGVPAKCYYQPDWVYRKGRLKAIVYQYGETYRVNCPFCSDTRKRLSINHHWGVSGRRTGDDMLFLATCFNEGCLNNREAQEDLRDIVYPLGGPVLPIVIGSKPSAVATRSVKIELPASRLIDKLPAEHSARRYLSERKFWVNELAEIWGVRYTSFGRSE